MKNYWLNRDKNQMSADTARQIAARIWCDKEFKTQVMDPKACEEIARILLKVANK